MTVLTQVLKCTGIEKRVPPGVTPVVELHLQPRQYIAGFDLKRISWPHARLERKTYDWRVCLPRVAGALLVGGTP